MIHIRTAIAEDAGAIAALMMSLGYPDAGRSIDRRVRQLCAHPDAELLVAEQDDKVVAVLSLHFIPQLALAGDFCRISYFCVSEEARGARIGAMLEAAAVDLARNRNCDRIELHSHTRRVDAHRFYYRQGYVESPKYLMKSLADTTQAA